METQPAMYTLKRNDKIFFLHIPKTAGTTLGVILTYHFSREERFPYYFLYELADKSREELLRYRYFAGHFHYEVICQLLGLEPICITMLRDPTERFISSFSHLQRDSMRPRMAAFFSKMTLEEYTNNRRFSSRTANRHTDMIAAAIPDVKQFLQDRSANIQRRINSRELDLGLAKQRIDSFAFTGLTERFEESLDLLCYTFGWRPIESFQTLNVADRRPRQEQLSPSLIDTIIRCNKLDHELYHYAARVFDERFIAMQYDLLERYGERAHAQLTPPLSRAIRFELLEKHYRKRFTENHPPVQKLHLELDEAVSGHGWYRSEHDPTHGGFRWTGPARVASLDLPVTVEQESIIRFRVLMALDPDLLHRMTLRANGQEIPLRISVDADSAYILEGRIPQSINGANRGLLRLEFEVPHVVTPASLDPNNPDDRELGLAINWVEINPLG